MSHLHVLPVYADRRTRFIRLADLLYLEGHNKFTRFVRKNKPDIISPINLGYFVDLLPDYFARTSKSFIVNFHHLEDKADDGYLHIDTGEEHPDTVNKHVKTGAEPVDMEAGPGEQKKRHVILLTSSYRASFLAAFAKWNDSDLLSMPEEDPTLYPDQPA